MSSTGLPAHRLLGPGHPTALVAALLAALILSGCQGTTTGGVRPQPGATVVPPTPETVLPVVAHPESLPSSPPNPYDGAVPGSGDGLRIGYLSMAEWNPFVRLVSAGITEQAAIAGVELDFCDAEYDEATTLACARSFADHGVQGVLNFQALQSLSPDVCAAYGDVPTIAIDVVQRPCQVAWMGADNRLAGRLGGEAVGRYAKDRWDCAYSAYVSMETAGAVEANRERMGGYRDGFRTACALRHQVTLVAADDIDEARLQFGKLLQQLPGDRIIVVAINENAIVGALQAAAAAGRTQEVFYSGQGADPIMWQEIACDPQYIASVAYFPERYGRTLIPAIIDIVRRGLAGPAASAEPPLPDTLYTRHEVVTRDNIRTLYPDAPSCAAPPS